MLALFTKSRKPTCSGSTLFTLRFFPYRRPYLSSQVAHVPRKFYSSPAGGQKLDKATVHAFKRVVALRKELERCDGVDLLYHRRRYALKILHEGITMKTVIANAWKIFELVPEHNDILSEMCKAERRKKENFRGSSEDPEIKETLQRLSDQFSDRPVLYHAAVPIVSRFEAMLDADAAQQRPLLSSQERTILKDVLKEYLRLRRFFSWVRLTLMLAVTSLMCWGFYRYVKWDSNPKARKFPEKERA